jgi:putative ABC transport system permease protein
LQSFAYRAPISPWIFLAAGFLAALIALFTVSSRAVRAADANPIKSLQNE